SASLPSGVTTFSPLRILATAEVLSIGKKLNEGKTNPEKILLQFKDQITAGNAVRKNHLGQVKAAISNKITSCVFQLLQEASVKTAFTRKSFAAPECEMIPTEWVCRRIATDSFFKRNPDDKEGYKFYPPKVEMFFKDDASNDPQSSEEQLTALKFCFGELLIEIVLADVIDNDSWRLWPSVDGSQQKDKQPHQDLKEGSRWLKKNLEWVAEREELLLKLESLCGMAVLVGSTSDLGHCEKIKKACGNLELQVTSVHKGPDKTLRIKGECEGDGIPTVFVAVAGRRNGLGPVTSGNTAYPVISSDWGAQDVWSSPRLPSGLSCSTTLSPEGSAQFAAQIFGLNNHLLWASVLNTWIFLKQVDKEIRERNL
uniref:PurE domain-containing protein n=1 Tax=Pan troglodytes TaxID=9598 RepID=A0A2I3RG32_PANTR